MAQIGEASLDEVLENFKVKLSANVEPKTGYDALYKNWGRLGNQEERRRELLDVQKTNRNHSIDKLRGIVDEVLLAEQEFNWKSKNDQIKYKPKVYVAGFHKVSKTFKDILMLSEWMVEKPEDFAEEWLVVPCPKGIRMLVVASKGKTKFFTKFGQFRFEMSTALPGGNPTNTKERHQYSVLDCFYVELTNTVFVLDVLAWNNQPVTDCETEFRQFWLVSKFSELPQLETESRKNNIKFKLLPKISCDVESFNQFMSTYPPFENSTPPVDGLLFYHKRAHYFNGETPLVTWLYSFMVPEILGTEIPIHQEYAEKPAGYINQKEFIQQFEENIAKRKARYQQNYNNEADMSIASEGDMDVSRSDSTTEESKNGAASMEQSEEISDLVRKIEEKEMVQEVSVYSK